MAKNTRKCKNCNNVFEKARPLQFICTPTCAVQYAAKERLKKVNAEWKQDKKVLREKLMSNGDYIRILQAVINKIAAIIDYGQPCMSCGKTTGKPQSGHFHSTSAQPALRFNLMNIWRQDYRCNVELSANIQGYLIGLKETLGERIRDCIVDLPIVYPVLKLDKYQLIEGIKNARKVLKEMDKDCVNDYRERIVLRKKYNQEIGIYK